MRDNIYLAETGTLTIFAHSTKIPYSYNRRTIFRRCDVNIGEIQKITEEAIFEYEDTHPKNKIKCYSIKYE